MKTRRSMKEIDFKYNIREYWSFLRKYKKIFFLLLFTTLIIEGTRILDKYLFKVIVDGGNEFVTGSILRDAFVKVLLIVVVIFASVKFIQILMDWFSETLLFKIDSNIIMDLKRKYFGHILGLSHEFHTTHKTGSLISRMGRGSGAIENMNDILAFNFSPLFFQLIIVTISLASISIVPGIVLAITSIVFISFRFYMEKVKEAPKLRYNRAQDIEKGNVGDIFTNIDSIKYFGKEGDIKRRFEKLMNKTKKASITYWKYHRITAAVQTLILSFGTFVWVFVQELCAGVLRLGPKHFFLKHSC